MKKFLLLKVFMGATLSLLSFKSGATNGNNPPNVHIEFNMDLNGGSFNQLDAEKLQKYMHNNYELLHCSSDNVQVLNYKDDGFKQVSVYTEMVEMLRRDGYIVVHLSCTDQVVAFTLGKQSAQASYASILKAVPAMPAPLQAQSASSIENSGRLKNTSLSFFSALASAQQKGNTLPIPKLTTNLPEPACADCNNVKITSETLSKFQGEYGGKTIDFEIGADEENTDNTFQPIFTTPEP